MRCGYGAPSVLCSTLRSPGSAHPGTGATDKCTENTSQMPSSPQGNLLEEEEGGRAFFIYILFHWSDFHAWVFLHYRS